jgi:diguanylate cyclase (GGDEF)-like protein
LLGAIVYYLVFSRYVTMNAEGVAVEIGQALIVELKPLLLHDIPGSGTVLSVSREDIPALDRNLRIFLHPFSISKIKIYDAEGRVIYSTDPNITGRMDANNKRLELALSGKNVSNLENRNKAVDLAGEQIFDADFVETYVPIRNESGGVVGCFEIYIKVAKYWQELWEGVALSSTMLAIAVLTVFALSYSILKKGTSRLNEAQARLELLAMTDDLTKIANRRHLIAKGLDEFERIRRNRAKGMPNAFLGCILLDIDHFKMVNDTKGHLAGDQAIKGVAARLQQCVRPYDIIGRFGGEEFAVLLPDTGFDETMLVAKRIWNSIRDEPLLVDDEKLRLTASLGVACLNDDDQKLYDLIKRADDGLYRAKNSGRDAIAWV